MSTKVKITHTGKSAEKVAAAFHEIKDNPPAVLAKTARKSGAAQAERQRVAIGLSKARAAGADIPRPLHGGSTIVSEDSLKGRGLMGRKGNLAAKTAFSTQQRYARES